MFGLSPVLDCFYHGLSPGLQDALGFAMADLPEREKVHTSFDTLYMLAKKMEAWQPFHSHRSGSGSSDTYRDKYQRYPAPAGWIAMLEEEELLPPDPESPDCEASELDQIEGLSLRMTQAMNHYQWEECCCFVCGATDHFARNCPPWEAFHACHREHLNSKRAGPQKKVPAPKHSLRKSPCKL